MKFSQYPPFLANAQVKLWLPDQTDQGNGYSTSPQAVLSVSYYLHHADDSYPAARNRAESMLKQFGATDELLKTAYIETSITDLFALESRGVRRKTVGCSSFNREPVQAFQGIHGLTPQDVARKALLVRQRRYLPESWREMATLYGPATATVRDALAVPA